MLKIIYWLLFDGLFIFPLVKWGDELGGYIFLFLVIIAFFTWELAQSIKSYIKDLLIQKRNAQLRQNALETRTSPDLFCRKCGNKLPKDSQHCNKCGAKVN